MTPTGAQRQLAEMIAEAQRPVVLTGAGISVPSGIPDFRTPGTGHWSHVNPMEVAHIDVWRENPVRFWDFYRHRLDLPDTFEPNAAHYALAELQRRGKLHGVITQNIDGLHQKAGLRDVVEVHGSVRSLSCVCGHTASRQDAKALFAADGVPYCPACRDDGAGAALKPDVVLFGEMLPEWAIGRAYALCDETDLLICVGSSLVVYPVAELPLFAQTGGAKVAVVARQSAWDSRADVHLPGDVAEELPGVLAALDELS